MADEKVMGHVSKNVGLPSYYASDYVETIDLPMCLMGGTAEMRRQTTIYLPQEEAESDNAYTARKSRTILFNAYKRTVQKLTGEVFSKDITYDEDAPEVMQEFYEDVDRTGQNLSRFSYHIFAEALAYGVVHILTEYPSISFREANGVVQYLETDVPEGEEPIWKRWTEEARKSKDARPYWTKVSGDAVLGWKYSYLNGKPTLTQVRIKEVTEETTDDSYTTSEVERVRVLEPGRWELWRKSGEKTEWVLESEGTTGLDFIPFRTFMPGPKMSFLTAEPPLMDLAWLNLMHYQSSSDQRNILHYARLCLWFGKGLQTNNDGAITFGANRLIVGEAEYSDLKVVEHQGNAIGAGRQDLQDLQEQMSMFGLTYMIPKTGTTTATEKAIDSSENDSALKAWAMAFKDFLEVVSADAYQMYGGDRAEGPGLSINTEFRNIFSDQSVKVLLDATVAGLLPKRLLMEELRRRGVIKDDVDITEIFNMFQEEAQVGELAPLGGAVLGAGGGATFP